MSMINISGIPNLGIPGLSGFSGGAAHDTPSGLASAQDQYLQNLRFFGNQAATQAAAEVPQSQLYGGGSFGAQPAYYAGVGAAYGRATGGFGGFGAPNADPFTPVSPPSGGGGASPPRVDVASSPFDTNNAGAVPYLSGGGLPFGGGGFSNRGGSVFSTGAPPVPYQSSPPPGSFSPSPNYPGGETAFNPMQPPPQISQRAPGQPQLTQDWDTYFGDVTSQAPGTRPRVAGGETGPGFPWGGTSGPGLPSSQKLLGYDPAQSASFAPGSGGGFQGRFGFGFPNAGTPSQVTTEPYESAQGQTYQPNIPPGYQTPFSVDNPGGALTRQMRQNIGQAPIMNAQDENPFEAGAPHIGPTMGPFMGAMPGGGVGRGAAPPSFAPSSPFEGGTSPVPYPYAGGQAFPGAGIGSTTGSMRDRIAAIMSGSQGNTPPPTSGPPTSGPPLVNGGPGGTGGPVPTAPQMNNAMDMLRQGRGWTIAQQTPPPQSGYAPINQAISSIGSVSRPGMFDNTAQPLGSMFSPSQYRGR